MSRPQHEQASNLIQMTSRGLYCPRGDFFIDPFGEVHRAVITHGHSDHARSGAHHYWCSPGTRPIIEQRLGEGIYCTAPAFGEPVTFNDVTVSLHPAGHIRGSAQVRIQHSSEVWVVTGDYKRCADPTAEAFEVVPCDVLVTETTFANPIYKWRSGRDTAADIFAWWQANRSEGACSMLFCYALGKAQRVLAELTAFTDETVYVHGAVLPLYEIYRRQQVEMLPVVSAADNPKGFDYAGTLVLAPPSAHRSVWMKRFKHVATGFASGWMQVRGNRRRRGYHRGFVMSDHADWPGLLQTVQECGAQRVYAMHGNTEVFARYLREQGIAADTVDALRVPERYQPEGVGLEVEGAGR